MKLLLNYQIRYQLYRIMCNITCGKLRDYFISLKYSIKNNFTIYEFNESDIQYLIEQEKRYPKNIYSPSETIRKIIDNRLSFARIGDGEFLLMCGIDNVHGNNSVELAKALRDICKKGSNNRCLIGINTFGLYNETDRWFCWYYLKFIKCIYENIKFNTFDYYGDAYAFKKSIINKIRIKELSFKKLSDDIVGLNKNNVSMIKNIWSDRDIVFVISKNSLVKNDIYNLFSNVKNKYFVYIPQKGCYSEYDRILNEILLYPKDSLIYLECGEVAALLAYRLSEIGYQAIDMGDFYKRVSEIKNVSDQNVNEKFSIIIPTMKKNVRVLDMLLDELVLNELIGEVIIIDNSQQETRYESSKIRVISQNKNIFVNPAWNLGVKYARYKYIGLLNDDLILPTNFFNQLLDFMKSHNGIGYIGLDTIPKSSPQDFIRYPSNANLEFVNVVLRPLCWECAIFFQKNQYDEIPKEMKIWYGDDYLFDKGIKNKKANYAIRNSNILHLHSNTSKLKEFDALKEQDKVYYQKLQKHSVINIFGIKIKFKTKT